ncbi:uncharacterized protein [Nicotiana tomentosiformis]|uniref:uncharacterized protein n=1 Tax=Nicotiana tomentosiformis TaxID=4098 RepID=UPI00388CA1C4
MDSEKVLLSVSPMKGVMTFVKKGNLSPQNIGPFAILERFGEVDYRLGFPPILSGVHSIGHISMLFMYYEDKSDLLDFSLVQLDKNLTYEEELVAILDRQVWKLRSKDISPEKIQLRGQLAKEVNWGTKDDIWRRYPYHFVNPSMILNLFEDKVEEIFGLVLGMLKSSLEHLVLFWKA